MVLKGFLFFNIERGSGAGLLEPGGPLFFCLSGPVRLVLSGKTLKSKVRLFTNKT